MADENKTPMFGDFGKMPSFDFTKLMKDFKLPGVDLATIMDREKKNIEALTEANRVAFEGWQALVHRQAEILQDSIKRAVGTVHERMRAPSAWTWRRTLSKPRFRTCANWPRWRPNLRRTRLRSFANASRKIWRRLVPPELTSRIRAHPDHRRRA